MLLVSIRLKTLKSSKEFTAFLISQAGSVEAGGIEGLAAVLTLEQAKEFVRSVRGKSFVIAPGEDGTPSVSLSNTPTTQTSTVATALLTDDGGDVAVHTADWNGPTCWQGWLAMGGYGASTGAICWNNAATRDRKGLEEWLPADPGC